MSWLDEAEEVKTDRAPKAAPAWAANAEEVPAAPAATEEPSFVDKLGALAFGRGRKIKGADKAMQMVGDKFVRPAMRYASGLVDTAVADVGNRAKTISLKDPLGQPLPEEVITGALKGKPHQASTLWRDFVKAPEGGRLSDVPGVGSMVEAGGPYDITTRGALAEAASLGLDPANKLAEYVRPIAAAFDAGGRGMFRNGLRKVTAEPLKFKNARPAPILDPPNATLAEKMNNRLAPEPRPEHAFADLAYDDKIFKGGSEADMVHQLESYLNDRVGPEYNKIIDDPKVAAQRSNVSDASAGSTAEAEALRREGSFGEEAADKFETRRQADMANDEKYFPEGRNPRQLLQRAKRTSDAARGQIGSPGDSMKEGVEKPVKDLLMTYGQDQRARAAELAEQALPGSVDQIRGLNRKYSLAKPALKVLRNNAVVEARKAPVTQVDAMLSLLKLPLVAAKHVVKYGNTAHGGVNIGNKLRALSGTNIWDNMLRRALGTTADDQEAQ